MNHLAHALIAVRTGTSIAGNLMGDFVKGRPEDRYDGALLEGIRLHRAVDAMTDDHPVFRRSRERMRPPFRRYAGILVDIFYDHVLARNWAAHSDEPLRPFVDRVYDELIEHRPRLPERMHRFVDYMLGTDLLMSYETHEGIVQALTGISHRMSRENPLDRAGEVLVEEAVGLDADFAEFFPDLLVRISAKANKA